MSTFEGQRFVVDTNVLVSHLLLPESVPGQALRVALSLGDMLVSDSTLTELATVINRPKFDKYISKPDRRKFFEVLAPLCIKVEIIQTIQASRDRKDDKFLEVAINGSADFILTGDTDLLELHPFHGIPIYSPTQFLEQKDNS
ncbi:MAG: putative toxin-antitoxin system toxin component, PIN family [Verrucomicrobia bacterium]|nr:putative toxin-antitoxin system toxin component, PIN family [Verrucomicrobiota bacterium]